MLPRIPTQWPVALAATGFLALTGYPAPTAAAAGLSAQAGTPERIAIPTLEEKLASGETFLLIDVREDYELEEGGAIEGAIHIPMGELEARMPDIPKDIELVFY